MEPWLSLTVLAGKSRFLISIPKKVVRQAHRRNRIKRVLREALRQEPPLTAQTHVFKVFRSPKSMDLYIARQAVHELLHQD